MKFFKTGLILFLLTACQIKRLDTSHLSDEIKATELKRITPEQITAFANEWGKEIADYLNISQANESNIDSLNHLFKAKITKIDLFKIDSSSIDAKEKQIYEAYQYNLKNKLAIPENLQKLNNGEIQLYTAAIKNQNNFIWRVEFSKKEIIKRVNIKDLKKLVTH